VTLALVALLLAGSPSLTPKLSATTKCEACHTTPGWQQGKFKHEKTGFPLLGAHTRVGCKDCHTGTFTAPVPSTCSGCHLDPHAGELGARCSGCHDEASWKSRFAADAHRFTAFPLIGRHAALPCEECHGEAREARFSRPVADCAECHLNDYARTALTEVNHLALGIDRDCKTCHTPWRFSPARFPQHDACFEVSAGPHSEMPCRTCHTQIPAVAAVGTDCHRQSVACASCHEHVCAKSDPIHKNVPGYGCSSSQCYECHQVPP
jgi:hypothetical protein